MSVLSGNPQTLNFLSPLNYRFFIKRAPNVNFFVQKVSAPGLMLSSPMQATALGNIPLGGDKIQYETLDIQFQIDENMANYLEIYYWLYGLAGPDGFQVPSDPPDNFNRAPEERALWLQKNYMGAGARSEIVVSILNSAKQPFVHFVYHDCVPTSLSSFDLDNRGTDVNYVVASASFSIRSFSIDTHV